MSFSDAVRRGALVPTSNGNGERMVVEPSPRPDILSNTPRPVDLVYALRRRWGWAVGLGLLSAGIAVGIAWLMIPVNYTATAWLRIAEQQPHILFNTSTGDEFLNHRRAQATLMTSNFVLNAALRKPGISQLACIREELDPVTFLRRRLSISFPGGSEILEIAMTGDDPSQLVAIVNAVKDAYMDEVVAVDRENQLRRKRVLEQAYSRNLEQIKKKTYLYQELANQTNASDSFAARQKEIHALDSLADHRARVNDLRRQVGGMERRLSILKARLGKNDKGEDITQDQGKLTERFVEMALAQDPWIAHAAQQIQALEMAKFEESLRAKTGNKAASVVRLQKQIDTLTEGIKKRETEMRPKLTEAIKAQVAQGLAVAPPTLAEQIAAQIADVEMDKGVTEKELEVAMSDFKDAAKEAEKLGAYSAELESRKVELDRLKKITYSMGDELEQREIELAAASRVTVLENATVPRSNDIDKKYRTVAFAGLAAAVVAVIGVAGVDFLSRRVNSPTEVTYGLGVQVMGDLPIISGRGRRSSVSLNNSSSGLHNMLIESVDNIRTALLHRANSESLRTVMVTSALEKEGKTTLSSQLAASLARSGRRTLLVDGDLRRPAAHRLFELPVEPGLSEVLRGEVELDQIIRPTRVPGLWLAAAGACDLEAIQSLARGGLHATFGRIREEFDFVIIDSGPVLTDADALLFGQYADAVILSILRDVSRVPRVFEACQRLRAVDLRLLGAVVNGVSFGKYRSYYRPYTIEAESASV
jgi:capsular exopolysaccharide synthesis family protein